MPDQNDYTPDFQTPGQIAANRAYAKLLQGYGADPKEANVTSNGIPYASRYSPLVSMTQALYGRQQMNAAGAQEQRRQNEPVASMLKEPIPGEQYATGGAGTASAINPPGSPGTPAGALAFSDAPMKGSWFGNFKGQNNWVDSSDSGLQASGVPTSVPGIALPNRGTLGQLFDITTPDGRTFTVRQTDLGPAKWTGRGVDVNAAAAEQMGYNPKNFPTDGKFTVKPHQGGGGIGSASASPQGGQALAFNGPGGPAPDTANDPQAAMTMALARGGGMQPPGPGAPSMGAPGRVPAEGGDASPYVPGGFFPQRQQVSRETMGKMMTGDVNPGLQQYMGNSYFGQYQPVERQGPFGNTVVRDARGNEMWIPPKPEMQHVTAGKISVERPYWIDPSGTQHVVGGGAGPVTQGSKVPGTDVPSGTGGYDIGAGSNSIGADTKPATPKPQSQAEPKGEPTKVSSLETGTATDAGGPLAYAPPDAGGGLSNAPPPAPGVKTAQAGGKGSFSSMSDQELANYGMKQEALEKLQSADTAAYSKNFEKYQEGLQTADAALPQINLLTKLFKSPDLIQGPWSSVKQAWNDAFTATTGNTDATTRTNMSQSVQKLISGGILGQMRAQLQGLGQVRLAEIMLLAQSTAAQTNTPAANAAIMFIAQKAAARLKEIGQLTGDYADGARWDKNGKRTTDSSDEVPTNRGMQAAIRTYMNAHPTISEGEMDDIEASLKAVPRHAKNVQNGPTSTGLPSGLTVK